MQDVARETAQETHTVLARYGRMRQQGAFRTNISDLASGVRCVMTTERGSELGEVVDRPRPHREGKVTGDIMRRATTADLERNRQIAENNERDEYRCCVGAIQNHHLNMKLADVEHILGGERIIFYFVAPQRVDFRGLVRDLARQFRTRIEMRQIGVRDEAKLLADYEVCGRVLCCKSYLHTIEPVSIKMAKNQATTLDPAKLAGRCGRLKCCLRYEDAVYTELRACLPRKGCMVETADGPAEVVDTDILQSTATVISQTTGIRKTLPVSELRSHCSDAAPKNPTERNAGES